jgi:phage N-6-adenine-methyltransferase
VSGELVTGRCRRCREPFELAATGRPRLYCSDACRKAADRKRRRRSVHFSSATAEWSTPQHVFDELDAEFSFELDVCATAENAKCERYFTRADNGLSQAWRGVCWMNPPYGREIGPWVRKAYESTRWRATVVCLVPARPGSRWWQVCELGEVTFLPGRLYFNDGLTPAPFPSAVVVFRPAFPDAFPDARGVREPVRERASASPVDEHLLPGQLTVDEAIAATNGEGAA